MRQPTNRRRRIGRAWLLAPLLVAACTAGDAAPPSVRGTIEAREVTVRSEVGGRITAVRVEEGDRVAAGQILVSLDREELEARLAAAKASQDVARARLSVLRQGSRHQEVAEARSAVDKAKTLLAHAEEERQRTHHLLELGSTSTEGYRRAETDALSARAELAAAEQRLSLIAEGPRAADVEGLEASLREAAAQVSLLQLQADKSDVKAPFAGVVTRRSVEFGEVASPGSPLCVVTDLTDLKVRVFVTERQLAAVKLHQEVDVRLEAWPDKRLVGHVLSIASASEFIPKDVETAEDRTFKVFAVRVGVTDPSGLAKPGTAAQVVIPSDEHPHAG